MLAICERSQREMEAGLLARCRAGERDALAQVFARYERPVFRYAYAMLGHRDDALDVQQETFLRAFARLPDFRGECSLLTWLLAICANLCRSHLRTKIIQRERQEDFETVRDTLVSGDSRTDPQQQAEHSEQAAILRRALQGLPPAQRELIILHEYEDISIADISLILHCAPVTVRVKLYRARRRLQERVAALYETGR